MQLRLTCNSPHHFYHPWPLLSAPTAALIHDSGKMRLLDRLLPVLLAASHKILIFSQFTTQLDLLEAYARDLRHWPVCRIDGAVPQPARRAQIATFNADPKHRLFLLSTRAGGLGINLAAADTVVLFDSDWNPQQDLQAMDRAHRIGQTRPVVVYRLATRGTVEQMLLETADAKRRLERLVIRKGEFVNLLNNGTHPAAAAEEDDGDGDGPDRDLAGLLFAGDDDAVPYDPDPDPDAETGAGELLSDRDLAVLLDRSDEAYVRAANGLDGDGVGGRRFRVVEAKGGAGGGDGADGVLAMAMATAKSTAGTPS